jgi:hypothetical protein
VESAEQDRHQLCDTPKGKLSFIALYGTYTVTLNNVKGVLQTSSSQKQKSAAPTTEEKTKEASDGGFREHCRRKRNSSTNTDTQHRDKKNALEQTAVHTTAQSMKKVPTVRDYFVLLRTSQMEAEENEPPTEEQHILYQVGCPL